MQSGSEGRPTGAAGTPAKSKTSQIGHNPVATPQAKSGTETKGIDSTVLFDPVVGGRARADSDVWYDATTGAPTKDGTSQASEMNRLQESNEGDAEVVPNGQGSISGWPTSFGSLLIHI